MRIIVTGTGRSGTGFMSKVLTMAGHDCGHERIFTPNGVYPKPSEEASDSSWMSMPYLDEYREAQILMPYRPPNEVIGSLIGIQFFELPSPYLDFAYREFPEMRQDMAPIEAANAFYQNWQARCITRADVVFPLTDIPWDIIARKIGGRESYLRAAETMTGNSYNQRRRAELDDSMIEAGSWATYERMEAAHDGIR